MFWFGSQLSNNLFYTKDITCTLNNRQEEKFLKYALSINWVFLLGTFYSINSELDIKKRVVSIVENQAYMSKKEKY